MMKHIKTHVAKRTSWTQHLFKRGGLLFWCSHFLPSIIERSKHLKHGLMFPKLVHLYLISLTTRVGKERQRERRETWKVSKCEIKSREKEGLSKHINKLNNCLTCIVITLMTFKNLNSLLEENCKLKETLHTSMQELKKITTTEWSFPEYQFPFLTLRPKLK